MSSVGRPWLWSLPLGFVFILVSGIFQTVDAPLRPQVLPLEQATIVIDPGHGGIDPGCHRDVYLEKDIVLAVGVELAGALEARGAHVILTRTTDVELSHLTDQESTRHRRDLRARVNIAEQAGADMFVSIHINTAASNQLGGAMVFFHPASPSGKVLADDLLAYLAPAVPGNQNSALPANFFILRHSSMPSVLVEIGFLSNHTDRLIILSPEGQQRIVEAMVAGIEQFWLRDPVQSPDQSPVLATEVIPFPLMDDHQCIAEYDHPNSSSDQSVR